MSDKKATPLTIGDAAPALALPDDTDTIRDLAAERGRRVVVFFYPKDFTSGCTTEVCEFRDSYAAFGDVDAAVWGVSVLDPASKAAFKAKHDLPFPLLADEDHAAAERYGVWVEKNRDGKVSKGVERSTFLVDSEGRIARVWRNVTPVGHAQEVLSALREA
jgi:peroxiredoxin Q/BCP